MRAAALMVACCAFCGVDAQQGYLPLSRVVDGPWTNLMQGYKLTAHSAIRPYLREDLAILPGADTLLPKAYFPWLQRITDPCNRVHGGPLIDAMGGASFGDDDVAKYRAGAGGWAEWNIGERWTLYADLQAWYETLPNYLDSSTLATQVTPGEGYAQASGSGFTHYDWNANLDYKAGKYLHFTLGKGKNMFGEGYRSLFLSDEAYSYPYFKITTTAWHFRYVNLYALMDDIRGAGGDPTKFSKKFTSMHYLSFNLSKRVNIGVFEAIVFQDNDPNYPRGFDFNYINPVLFYRPTEYGLGSPDNSLLGLALNVKVGHRTMLYSQLMLDEFLLSNVRAGKGWYGNKQGLQLGFVTHDAFLQKGLTLRGEVDYVRPFMYTHSDTRQNYAGYGQALAHPYGSGFVEALVQGEWRKDRWLFSDLISYSMMGQDTSDADQSSYGNNIFLPETDRPTSDGLHGINYHYYIGQPGKCTVVQNELRAGYQLEPRSGLMLEFAYTLRVQDPDVGQQLMTNYVRVGLSANIRERHPLQTVRYRLQ